MLRKNKMPGYTIHLAVGKIYSKNNEIQNIESFIKGIIAPDQAEDKKLSHYGPCSSKPNLQKYINENELSDSFNEGYFLHLLTDKLFYNKFLKKWNKSIYDDYDKLNKKIIEKYEINVPKEIQKDIGYKEGKLDILDEKTLYEFIENVGRIDIRSIIKNSKQYNQNIEMHLERN